MARRCANHRSDLHWVAPRWIPMSMRHRNSYPITRCRELLRAPGIKRRMALDRRSRSGQLSSAQQPSHRWADAVAELSSRRRVDRHPPSGLSSGVLLSERRHKRDRPTEVVPGSHMSAARSAMLGRIKDFNFSWLSHKERPVLSADKARMLVWLCGEDWGHIGGQARPAFTVTVQQDDQMGLPTGLRLNR